MRPGAFSGAWGRSSGNGVLWGGGLKHSWHTTATDGEGLCFIHSWTGVGGGQGSIMNVRHSGVSKVHLMNVVGVLGISRKAFWCKMTTERD